MIFVYIYELAFTFADPYNYVNTLKPSYKWRALYRLGGVLFSTSSCALAFSYRSQVKLGRKVCITYTTSSHGLQLALVW